MPDIDPNDPLLGNFNDATLERLWAAKAFAHADAYERILNTVSDTKKIRLTKIDDKIYEHFRKVFPDLNVEKFDYEQSKSDKFKVMWREFSNQYNDEIVKDWNMATLMRLNALEEFSEENCCIVLRIQFHAIEIARNREGINAKRTVPPS
eukprot:UN03020